MTKRISKILAVLMAMLMVVSVPFAAQAATKLDASISAVYTKTTTPVKVKLNGKKIANSKCKFSSSNKSIATVDAEGNVKGIKKGSCTITVKLKSKTSVKKSVKITVKNNLYHARETKVTYVKGSKAKIVAYTNNNARAADYNSKFSSSDKSVATVDSKGNVKALKAGKTIIKMTGTSKQNKGMTYSITVTVVEPTALKITPTSNPLNSKYLDFSTYNKTSKNYYVLRSYLDYAEAHPGTTITLAAGTYNLCTALYIPSNTKIVMNSGTILNKISATGSSGLDNSGSMFMFCAPSMKDKAGAYSGYNGVHDVTIVGNGATIDMADAPKDKTPLGFVFCHNNKISISGLKFKNIKRTTKDAGHFMEMDASSNVTVSNCTFSNHSTSVVDSVSECINLDTPDKKTGGFSQPWTSYDATPNKYVTISNCTFTNVQRGVGTHQYSGGKYHNYVTINNCKFYNCKNGAISMINWTNARITNNLINGAGKNTSGTQIGKGNTVRAIEIAGCSKATISGNVFKNCYEALRFTPKMNPNRSTYPAIYNNITDAEFDSYAANNKYDYSSGYSTYGDIKNYPTMVVQKRIDTSTGTANGSTTDGTKANYSIAAY